MVYNKDKSENKFNLASFIAALTDHELSIFFVYRFDDFLDNSKQKIIDEILARNLGKDEILKLYKAKLDSQEGNKIFQCPRCGSDKSDIETDLDQRIAPGYRTKVIAIETHRCRLCGYNPDKQTQKTFMDRIKHIFKSHKNEKVIKFLDWI